MRYILLMLVMLACAASTTLAQSLQTISFNQDMKVDELGDCAIKIAFNLNAKQYAAWNQKYGQNKSMLKRDLGKVLSQYDTYDWKIDVAEMDRQITVGVKAHGAVKHDGGGRYEFPVPKNWKGGGLNGNTLEYNYIEPLGEGAVGQYQIKLVLPASATGIKNDTGESGEPIVRYSVPVPRSHGGLLLSAGIIIMVLGLAAMLLGVFAQRLGLGAAGQSQQSPPPPPAQGGGETFAG